MLIKHQVVANHCIGYPTWSREETFSTFVKELEDYFAERAVARDTNLNWWKVHFSQLAEISRSSYIPATSAPAALLLFKC